MNHREYDAAMRALHANTQHHMKMEKNPCLSRGERQAHQIMTNDSINSTNALHSMFKRGIVRDKV